MIYMCYKQILKFAFNRCTYFNSWETNTCDLIISGHIIQLIIIQLFAREIRSRIV